MKHSKAIIAIWIVLLVCALPFGLKAGDNLQYDMTQMSGVNTESTDGLKVINEQFSTTIDLSEILVISYNSAEELTQAGKLSSEFCKLVTEKYGSTLTASNYGTYSKGDATKSGIMMVAIACNDSTYDVTHQTGNIRDLVSQAKTNTNVSLTTYVTGNAAITYDTETSSTSDVAKVDPISIVLIFLLLGLFFYALVTALVPPAVVGMAYGIALSAIFGISCVLDVFYITQILVLITMLGAGCDYALFIISRYRDERKNGASHESALRTSIMWAGESVFTSGLSVIIGFGALSLCSFSMVQSMGIVLALGIVIALIAALTFIPSLVNVFGEKIFWPSKIDTYKSVDRGENKGIYSKLCHVSRRYFSWLSVFTEKHAIAIVVAAIILMAPLVYVFATTNDSSDMISIMPESESTDGLDAIMGQTDGGTIMPTYVVLELNESAVDKMGTVTVGGTTLGYLIWTDKALASDGTVVSVMTMANDIDNKYEIAGSVSGINAWSVLYQKTAAALKTTDPSTINHALVSQMPSAVSTYITKLMSTQIAPGVTLYDVPYTQTIGADGTTPVTVANVIDSILNYSTGIISDNGKFVNMMVITTEKPMSDNTMAFINDLKNDFHGAGGYDSKYSGIIAKSYVSGTSAVMNDISDEVENQFSVIRIVVIVALIVLLFLILGSYLTPIRSMVTIVGSIIATVGLTRFVFSDLLNIPVLWLVPIVLFVVLLGLGMDYDIFLTTRIKENKVKGMTNSEAIRDAVKNAGPVTSLCSLIMGGTFLTMLLTSSSMLQEFGFALGVGILIEGLLMVAYVVPALMHLMGDWSWKGPKFLNKRAE